MLINKYRLIKFLPIRKIYFIMIYYRLYLKKNIFLKDFINALQMC